MAMIAPPSLVAAPARTPLPFGLGSVIVWRTGERWESGVEWDSITCDPAGGRGGPHCNSNGIAAAQTLEGAADSGTFTLSDGENTTAAIAFDADAATITAALAAATIEATATGGPLPADVGITFTDAGVQDALTVDNAQIDGEGYTITVVQPGLDPIVGLPKQFNGSSGHGNAEPFVVYGHDLCNPIGGGGFDASQERATAHLIAREEARAEQALWTGDLGNVPNFSGANGYTAPTSVGAFDGPVKALAAIEQGIAEVYGSQGVIHMSRHTASLLKGDLTSRGGRLYTNLDTPVVAGAGYPDGAMIGSPALIGYRSEVFTASNRPGDLLDRATNEMYAIAERSYIIGLDPCPLVSATFAEEVTP